MFMRNFRSHLVPLADRMECSRTPIFKLGKCFVMYILAKTQNKTVSNPAFSLIWLRIRIRRTNALTMFDVWSIRLCLVFRRRRSLQLRCDATVPDAAASLISLHRQITSRAMSIFRCCCGFLLSWIWSCQSWLAWLIPNLFVEFRIPIQTQIGFVKEIRAVPAVL